jgi:cobalt-zinc-cadmium efflux system membrane fusion protein
MKNNIKYIFLLTILLYGCSNNKELGSQNEVNQETSNVNQIIISPEALSRSNIKITKVSESTGSEKLKTIGEIVPDENRVFHISSFTAGKVIADNVMLGDFVKAGQTLALVQNQDVAKIYADFIHNYHQNEVDIRQAKIRLKLADETLKREEDLLKEGVSPRKNYQQAYADQALAKSSLDGLQEHSKHLRSEADALLSVYGVKVSSTNSEAVKSSSPISAPKSGVIIKKNITLGDVVAPDIPLYLAADLGSIWLTARIYSQDVSKLAIGDEIEFVTDSLPGQKFKGQINYIQPSIDSVTKTYLARTSLSNPGFVLKPGMNGQALIAISKPSHKAFIPQAAVQEYQGEQFVFVSLGKGIFEKRKIKLGISVLNGYLVDEGLEVGEKIVSEGSFLLKAEMLKTLQKEE